MTSGEELVVLYTRTKNNLYGSIEGETHFGMPRGAKTSLVLGTEIGCSSFKIKYYLMKSIEYLLHPPQVERNY
jgi:hypothetical protein